MEREEQETRATSELDDAMKLEYSYLRERLLQNTRLRAQIFGISIAAVGVSMSIGIAESAAFIFLIPVGILISSLYYSIGSYHVINRISTYIRCFFETPATHLRWETRLAQFRQIEKNKNAKNTKAPPPVRWAINVLYHILIFANIILFVLYLSNGYGIKILISIPSFIGWLYNISYSKRFKEKCRSEQYKEYLDKWQKIRRREES